MCNSAAMTCTAPPAAGMPVGSGCGTDSVCASGTFISANEEQRLTTNTGFCSTGFTCQVRVVVPTPSGAAAAAAKKRKRFLSGGEEVSECPRGSTACPLTGWFSQGFEVSLVVPSSPFACRERIADGLVDSYKVLTFRIDSASTRNLTSSNVVDVSRAERERIARRFLELRAFYVKEDIV